MTSQKNKILIAIKVDNVVDVITNSSSELFVLKGQTKEIVSEMISNIYPNYLNEYEELKSLDEMTNEEIDTFLDWHLGPYSWSSRTIISDESRYKMISGFAFNEIYDTSVVLTENNTTYEVINNKPIKDRTYQYDSFFVNEDNRQRVIDGLKNDIGEFFLYSIDENPNWDYQEKLMDVGQRFHLG